MDKKYFFFDIDGTLTDRSTGKIVPSAQEALKKLKAAGHFVAIATGRAHYKARWFFDIHDFDHMVCAGGHGIVIDKKLVENPPLDFESASALYKQATDAGYGVLSAIDDSQKVYAKDFLFYEQAGLRLEPTTYIIDERFEPKDQIYKMYIAIPDGEESKLPALDALGYLRFEKNYIIIQPDEKEKGIYRTLEILKGDINNVVVFGDDTNDLVMFRPEFTKVAMGNACDALKAKADIIAPANIDDGIYRVCEAQGWF